MPRRAWLVYLGLAALAHPILEMLLFREQALQPAHDVFDNDVPRLFSIATDWRQFGPSLWDPHLTSGNALLAQFAQPPLAPDVLLSFVLPPFVAYFLAAALLAFLAGLSMHLFLRESLRLPAIACFAGGALAVFASWPYIYGFGAPLLPLAALWSEQAAAASGPAAWRAIVRLALLVGFLILSSQIQVVVLAGAVAVVWAVLTSMSTGARASGRASGRAAVGHRALRLFSAWGAGALLGAPVLLTLAFALGDSQRSLWVLDPVASPLGAWLDQLASIVFGVRTAKLGGFDQTYGSFYPGVVGLPLLLASLAIPRPDRRSRAALWLLIGLLLIDLVALVAMPLQAQSSLLKSFQFVRVLHLVPVLIVVNAALALGWLATPGAVGQIGRPRRAAILALGGLGLLFVVPQLLTVVSEARQVLVAAPQVAATPPRTLAWLFAVVAFGAGLTSVALAAALTWTHRRRRGVVVAGTSRATIAAPILVCLVLGLAVDRAAFTRFGLLSGPNIGTWASWTEPTPAQRYVASQPSGGRSVSVLEHANRGLSAGLHGVDGYETLYPKAYHALFGLLIEPQLSTAPGLADYYRTWGNRAYAFTPAISQPIADLLGVRWMLVAHAAVDAGLAQRAGPQPPVPTWLEEATTLDGTTVYQNAGAFPRTFLVHAVAIEPDADAAIAAMGAATASELRSTVYIVAGDAAGITMPVPLAAPAAGELANLTLDTPDGLEIRTATNSDAVLVVADTFAHGWVAELDGRPTDLFRVDLALRGVYLPAGTHVVTMRYQPIETLAGFGVAAVTLVGLLALTALARARRSGPESDRTRSTSGA